MMNNWKYDKFKKLIFIISILVTIISSIGIIYILLNSNNISNIDSNKDIKIIKDTTSLNTDEVIYNEFVLLNLDLKKYRKFVVTINNSEEIKEGIPTKIEQGELKNLDNEVIDLINKFLSGKYTCYDDNYYYVIEYQNNSYKVCHSEDISLLNKLFE